MRPRHWCLRTASIDRNRDTPERRTTTVASALRRLFAVHIRELFLQRADLRQIVVDDVRIRRVLLEEVLVIRLCRIKRLQRIEARDDRTRINLRRLELRDAGLGDLRLRLVLRENLRAILRAGVRSLAVELRWVVRDPG